MSNASARASYSLAFKFCRTLDAASCAASAPPVTPALRIRSPKVSTFSGGILSSILLRVGRSANFTTLAIGSMSSSPITVPRAVTVARSSSVAPAALARSLASPAPAPAAARAPRPRAAVPGAPAAAAAAGKAAIPAIDPKAWLI